MGMIVDTSVFIAGERGRFDLSGFFSAHDDEHFYIAAITASELLHGVERADTKARRESRSRYVEEILTRIPIIDFDLSVARRHAVLWAKLERTGKKIGPHDLLIAATALERGHSVVTLNLDEFYRVPGLQVSDVKKFIL
jgi:predicted nucleic acid-binding protein